MSELSDEPTVCPDHLRFVPCRHCEPGQEKFSTDPVDVGRVPSCGCALIGVKFRFCPQHALSPEVEAVKQSWMDRYTPDQWGAYTTDLLRVVTAPASRPSLASQNWDCRAR